MRKFFSLSILSVLALYLESNATIWASYYALQDEIAKHCENRTSADCNGKCQMKKVEQTNPDAPLLQINAPEVSEFLIKKILVPEPFVSHTLKFYLQIYANLSEAAASELFRPPISA